MLKNKDTRKYAVTAIAAAAGVATVVPFVTTADAAKSFPDVKPGGSGKGAVGDHYDSIMYLATEGVINGKSDGKFYPWENVTRGQVAKMLVEAQGIAIPSNIDSVLSVYNDVDANNAYADYIAAATKEGIYEGKDGVFGEYEFISRQQMASVLVRTFNLIDIDTGPDVQVNLSRVSDSHKDSVQTLANLGLTKKLSNFGAYENNSRAAFSTFLTRIMNDYNDPNTPDDPIGSVDGMFEMNAIGTVYDESGASNTNATAYDREVEVFKVNDNGSKTKLSHANGDFTVSSTHSGLNADVSANGIINAKTAYVSYSSGQNTAQLPITVTIDETGEELTQNVTFSKVAPKVKEIDVMDEGTASNFISGSSIQKLTAFSYDAANEGNFTVAEYFDYADVVATDQYGAQVEINQSSNTFKDTTPIPDPILTLSKPQGGSLVFMNNGTPDVEVTVFPKDEYFPATIGVDGVNGSAVTVTASSDLSSGNDAEITAVIDQIDALNHMDDTYLEDVGNAREALNELTDTQKGAVTNLYDLLDAEQGLVFNEQDLKTAVLNVTKIFIVHDITLANDLKINKKVSINGNGKTIKGTYNKASHTEDSSTITITKDNVEIANLTVDADDSNPNANAMPYRHALEVIDAVDAELTDITVKNGHAGLLVNAYDGNARANVSGITTIGNGFAGMKVYAKRGGIDGTLNISGRNVHDKSFGAPDIWMVYTPNTHVNYPGIDYIRYSEGEVYTKNGNDYTVASEQAVYFSRYRGPGRGR